MFGSPGTFGNQAKPTGFGTPMGFGTPAAATAAPTAGFSFGSNFGATPQQQQQPANTFGTPANQQQQQQTAAAPLFGGGTTFGTPTASTAPTFGSSFGTPAVASATPAFGATANPNTAATSSAFGLSAFGTTTTSTPSLFGAPTSKPGGGLFNTGAPASAPSLFSTTSTSAAPLFGTNTQAPSLFGSQAPTATTSSLFASTSTPSLFGTSFGTTTTTTPSLFGSNAPAPTFGGFKAPTSAPQGGNLFGGFGTGFGGASAAPTFGFGSTAGGVQGGVGSLFGAKPIEQQQNQQQQVLASFYAIHVFGDERDDTLKKWNMLQASWGTGKGFYNTNQPPVEYDQTNPFYRFKAISYAMIPDMDNADGLVKMIINKKDSEVESQKGQIINGFNGILGNKPNLTVSITNIKPLSDTQCEVMLTVSEKGITGVNRKIHATDLSAYFNQPTQKQQLTGAGIAAIFPFVSPSKAQVEEYLKEPPKGIDPQLWKAAQIDNPNPTKYLPAPMLGFGNLKKRMICGEFETGLHKAFLDKVNGDILELKKKHAASLAQIEEQKQKFLQLQHRVLKILVKQECTRKLGLVLQPEEELLKSRLEMLHTHLNMPTQFRGKIKDLNSSVKVSKACNETNKSEVYKIDPQAQEEIKQFLKMEQQGITHLISIINNDLKDLKIISDGLQQSVANK